MTDEPAQPPAGGRGARLGVLRWSVPLATLLVASFALAEQPLVDLRAPLAIAIAAGLASAVAALTARKLAIPLLLLALLTWSGDKSEINPGLLVSNRDRAAEYVFGRSLTPEDLAQTLSRAESTLASRLESRARDQVEDELEAAGGQQPTDAEVEVEVEAIVARRAAELRDGISLPQWEAMVRREAERLRRDRRGGFFPPERDPEKLARYADALLETIAIAIWGTALAVLTALPAALLGSTRALAVLSTGSGPLHRLGRRVGVFLTRRGFDACRGFNEFVLALIFVAILGLGPFAGVLALAVHTFGVLGKVFADALETVRQGEIEGVTATGASPAHVVSLAVLPQIMPYIVSQSLLRFESNVRSASVLGLVGAGGIGFLIDAKLKAYAYQEVATMMILIIVVVSLIDFGCGRIMARFV